MNSVEKDNIVDKAMCCSGTLAKKVADMYISGHRCADKEFQKLFLLISYTEALGCYQAPLEETTYTFVDNPSITGEYTFTTTCVNWDTVLNGSSGIEFTYTLNGVETTVTTSGDTVSTVQQLFISNLTSLGYSYVVSSCVNSNKVITVTTPCGITDMALHINVVVGPALTEVAITVANTIVGNCNTDTLTPVTTITEYTNCLTEDQADNIATQISKICDLCDEH